MTQGFTGSTPSDAATDAWRWISLNTISAGTIIIPMPVQSGYGDRYYFYVNAVTTGINGSNFYFEISIDNQVSWINTGYLSGINIQAYNSATITNVNSTTFAYLARAVNFAGSGTGAITGVFWIDAALFKSPCLGEMEFWDNNPNTATRGQMINQLPNTATRITDIRVSATSNLSTGNITAVVARQT